MDYSSILTKTVDGIEKNVQKAVICINDISRITRNANQSFNATAIVNAAFEVEKAFRSKDKTGAGETMQARIAEMGYRIMEVQFNPEELSFSLGQKPEGGSKSGNKGKAALLSQSVKNVMTIPLIFENIVYTDAFIWDRQNMLMQGNSGNKDSPTAGIIMEECSVKTRMDGLMSLVSNPAARSIVFCWGDMVISGLLQGAEMEYNMFNPSGNPIKGKIILSVAVNFGTIKSGTRKYWDKAFDKLFDVSNTNAVEDITNTIGTISRLIQFSK